MGRPSSYYNLFVFIWCVLYNMCLCACACVCVCVCVCVHISTFSMSLCVYYIVCYCSEFSDSVTYTCAAAAPEAPPIPECIDIGVRHVTVRWSSPEDNGGEHFTAILLEVKSLTSCSCHN